MSNVILQNKFLHHGSKELSRHLIQIMDQPINSHRLQLAKGSQGKKDMITDCFSISDVKSFNIANLLDDSMKTLNTPMTNAKEETYSLVSEELQVWQTRIPTITRYPSWLDAPAFYFMHHFNKIIILCFVLLLVANTIINGIGITRNIGVIQRNQIDSLNRSLMFTRPEVTHKFRFIGISVQFIDYRIIHTQRSTL